MAGPPREADRVHSGEVLCWLCGNTCRVFYWHPGSWRKLIGDVLQELECPYCGGPSEVSKAIEGVERLAISEPRRKLAMLSRRLGWCGAEVRAQLRRVARKIARYQRRLKLARRASLARHGAPR